MGGNDLLPQNVARCPGDNLTKEMGRLGSYTQPGGGAVSNVLVSIGCNDYNMSSTARTRPAAVGQWVKFSMLGGDHTRLMLFGDWQNYPGPTTGTHAPVTEAITKLAGAGIGNIPFRHNGAANVVYFDGHVGEIRTSVKTRAEGHEFLSEPQWPTPGGGPPSGRHYFRYYPFGNPSTMPSRYAWGGDFPNLTY
jgi:prepilin-type processing-associated H-X9-DG protein